MLLNNQALAFGWVLSGSTWPSQSCQAMPSARNRPLHSARLLGPRWGRLPGHHAPASLKPAGAEARPPGQQARLPEHHAPADTMAQLTFTLRREQSIDSPRTLRPRARRQVGGCRGATHLLAMAPSRQHMIAVMQASPRIGVVRGGLAHPRWSGWMARSVSRSACNKGTPIHSPNTVPAIVSRERGAPCCAPTMGIPSDGKPLPGRPTPCLGWPACGSVPAVFLWLALQSCPDVPMPRCPLPSLVQA